jgi:hypothetical protein
LKRKADKNFFAKLRVAELEKLFYDRYHGCLPDDDAGREDLELLLHHVAYADPKGMIACARQWAPWLSLQEATEIAAKIALSPQFLRADPLAQLLNLGMEERTRLGIRTIGAVDATKEERAEIARRNRAERKKATRRAGGVRPREEYETNSLSNTKPWKAEGISRRTWFRRRARQGTPARTASPNVISLAPHLLQRSVQPDNKSKAA